jgi:hypothetical protein
MTRILARIRREPALVVGLVLALANLWGADLSDHADLIESAVVLLGSLLVRQRVTPVTKG